ncbi:RNA polymerase sigma factor [Chitinophaga arvensicola]|uniref:RNA polymerase sigma-70 factor, ECF subfamily n=1 Tax=Chitinophaga arvensicola TaxID=29529 RepID=A0A1I0S8T3_9BACT|nr:RNA polymerase sigma-70 factor [Chitinophaga arvensicola]SEW52567.1 RNA polymerase sigma-70 factor, ECF subfamily [Chitinophaga arvensicola]
MEPSVKDTTHSLLLRVALGQEDAFREFFHEYSGNIYTVALMMTKSAVVAEDMVQEIFLKLWLNRAALAEIDNIRGYIFINARNYIFNELRKKSYDQHFTDDLLHFFSETSATPEQALLQKESGQLLKQAIDHLPTQQQHIYRLSREEGLTQEEIAERLHISKHTVRNHMAQALQNIRRFLESRASGLLLLICAIEIFLWKKN